MLRVVKHIYPVFQLDRWTVVRKETVGTNRRCEEDR